MGATTNAAVFENEVNYCLSLVFEK